MKEIILRAVIAFMVFTTVGTIMQLFRPDYNDKSVLLGALGFAAAIALIGILKEDSR